MIILIASVGPYFWGSVEQLVLTAFFNSSVLWLYKPVSKYAFTYKHDSISLSLYFP